DRRPSSNDATPSQDSPEHAESTGEARIIGEWLAPGSARLQPSGGAAIRSSAESTAAKRSESVTQSALASAISSQVRATKFHHMRISAPNGSPPSSRILAGDSDDRASASWPSGTYAVS